MLPLDVLITELYLCVSVSQLDRVILRAGDKMCCPLISRPCHQYKGNCDDMALAGGIAPSLAFFGFLWYLSV